MKIIIVVLVIFAGLIALGWLGLRIRTQPFAALAQQTPALKTVPLPAGLPAPVERFYRQLYGNQVPVIESAVITGRATMRPVGGLKLPARFRFVHQVGQDYRHYFELTWFGRTIGTGNEHYLDGKSRLALPMGLSDEGPQVDQAANLSLWAEYVWLPAVFIIDPRVRWEPVDENTALLAVPFGDQLERFVARFDPTTGRLQMLDAMRYKDSKSTAKTLWLNESQNWATVGGYQIPTTGAVTWFDQGRPWAVFTVEDIVFNVDVQELLREGRKLGAGCGQASGPKLLATACALETFPDESRSRTACAADRRPHPAALPLGGTGSAGTLRPGHITRPTRTVSSLSPTYPLGQVNTRLAADARQPILPYTVGEVEK